MEAVFKQSESFFENENNFNLLNFETLFNVFPSVIYVLDHINNKFIYLNPEIKNLIGISANEILHKDVNIYENLIHKEDIQNMKDHIVTPFIDYLQKIDKDRLKHIQISKNYRIKHKNGTILKCLDQSVILVNEPDKLLTLGVITDISRYKTDNDVTFSISEYDNNQKIIKKILFRKEIQISKREKEIINLIVQGYSSKIIADILKISINTVNTHRQNLLKKMDCNNTAELIASCKKFIEK